MLYHIIEFLTEKIWLFNAFIAISFTLFLLFKLKKDFSPRTKLNDDSHQ